MILNKVLERQPSPSAQPLNFVKPVEETGGEASAANDPAAEISVIGPGIVITGNIEAEAGLQILGKVVGDVRCVTLLLGESSAVQGDIHATRVSVSGTVEGELRAKHLAIGASGQVTGDITYEQLRVAAGGSIQGRMMRRAGMN